MRAAFLPHRQRFKVGQSWGREPNLAPLQIKTGIRFSRAYGLSTDVPTYSTCWNNFSSASLRSSRTIMQFPL